MGQEYAETECSDGLGLAYRACGDPARAVRGDGAMEVLGWSRDGVEPSEWRRMLRLARLAPPVRGAGSAGGGLAGRPPPPPAGPRPPASAPPRPAPAWGPWGGRPPPRTPP